MLAIELGLGALVLGPRRARLVACAGCTALMLLIMATGNYGFFNLLAIALCVLLLDDRALRGLVPGRWRARLPAADERDLPRPHALARAAYAALAAVVIFLTGAELLDRLGWHPSYPAPLAEARVLAAPLRTFNSYGLFAVMTTERPTIVIEGRRAGGPWRSFEPRYAPGALDRAPPFVEPHMPRLDWQLWFAALRGCGGAPWFEHLLKRLLEGAAPVEELFANDPFPDAPPDEIRTTRYLYRFAGPGSHAWWVREPAGPFCPTVALRDGRLVAVGRD
jgi:hypothetical protein